MPVVVSDSTYRPGQVSSYKARPGERSSTVTILRVETLPKAGVIVHVRIDGVGSRTAQECPRLPPCNMLFFQSGNRQERGSATQNDSFSTRVRG